MINLGQIRYSRLLNADKRKRGQIDRNVLGLNNKNIVIFSQILTDVAQKYDQLWSDYVMQDGSVCDIPTLFLPL